MVLQVLSGLASRRMTIATASAHQPCICICIARPLHQAGIRICKIMPLGISPHTAPQLLDAASGSYTWAVTQICASTCSGRWASWARAASLPGCRAGPARVKSGSMRPAHFGSKALAAGHEAPAPTAERHGAATQLQGAPPKPSRSQRTTLSLQAYLYLVHVDVRPQRR